MINFKLDQDKFNDLKTKYKIIKINSDNFKYSYRLIIDSIKYFNSEIEWDGMFDFNTAHKRISSGMTMYVGMMDSDVFGHVWFRDENKSRYLFNLFVRNIIPEKNYTGKEFLSHVISKYEFNKSILCEVDEWNEKSIKLFKRLGFEEIL